MLNADRPANLRSPACRLFCSAGLLSCGCDLAHHAFVARYDLDNKDAVGRCGYGYSLVTAAFSKQKTGSGIYAAGIVVAFDCHSFSASVSYADTGFRGDVVSPGMGRNEERHIGKIMVASAGILSEIESVGSAVEAGVEQRVARRVGSLEIDGCH